MKARGEAPPGKRASWDDETKAYLLELLQEFRATKKKNGQWCRNNDVWGKIAERMNAKFTKSWGIHQIKDLQQQLRSLWDDIREILRHPDFKWDHENNMLDAGNSSWIQLIDENSKYKAYRFKQYPYYNSLRAAYEGHRDDNDEICHASGDSCGATPNQHIANSEQVQPISQGIGIQDVQQIEIEALPSSVLSALLKPVGESQIPQHNFLEYDSQMELMKDSWYHPHLNTTISNNVSVQLSEAHSGNYQPPPEKLTSMQGHSNQQDNNFTHPQLGFPPNVRWRMNNTSMAMNNLQQQSFQHHSEASSEHIQPDPTTHFPFSAGQQPENYMQTSPIVNKTRDLMTETNIVAGSQPTEYHARGSTGNPNDKKGPSLELSLSNSHSEVPPSSPPIQALRQNHTPLEESSLNPHTRNRYVKNAADIEYNRHWSSTQNQGALKQKRRAEVAEETDLVGQCIQLSQQLGFRFKDIDHAIEIFRDAHYQKSYVALNEVNKKLWLRKKIEQRRKLLQEKIN